MRLFLLILLVVGITLPALAADKNLFVFDPHRPIIAKVTPLGQSSLISLLDSKTMEQISQFEVPGVAAQSVEFGANGQLLVASPSHMVTYDLSSVHSPVKRLDVMPEPGEQLSEPHFAPDTTDVYWAEGDKLYTHGPAAQASRVVAQADQKITDLTPLKDRRVALSEEGSSDVSIYSAGSEQPAERLKAHRSEVAGVESPDGQNLYSVSKDNQLIRWDMLHQRPTSEFQLDESTSPAKLQSDDLKQKLYVVKNKDGKLEVFGYRLFDLERGQREPKKESLVQTGTGAVYSGFDAFEGSSKKFGQFPAQRVSPKKALDPNSPYQLAKIEADNGNYNASLEQIRQVKSDDAEFRQSRVLRRQVFQKVENQQNLNVAKEQYQVGNYKAAQILLEGVLAKDPQYHPAKRYLKLTQSKRSNQKIANFFWILFLLILTVGLGYLIWRWKEKHPTIAADFLFKKMDGDQRRRLIGLIRKTEQLLALRRKQDKMGYYHAKLARIEAQINQCKIDLNDDKATFSVLFEKVSLMHQDLFELGKGRGKKSAGTDQETSARTEQTEKKPSAGTGEKAATGEGAEQKTEEKSKDQEQKKSTSNGQSSKQSSANENQQKSQKRPKAPSAPDSEDWYQLLGISPTASTQEVKEAYRKKIKEYHPDKHNSSDFDWVKQEAERMTRLVGQAYECLLSPTAREKYDKSRS